MRKTVVEALANYKSVSIYQIDEPITVELTFYRTDFCEKVLSRYGSDVTRTSARTLQRKLKKITKYEDLKF